MVCFQFYFPLPWYIMSVSVTVVWALKLGCESPRASKESLASVYQTTTGWCVQHLTEGYDSVVAVLPPRAIGGLALPSSSSPPPPPPLKTVKAMSNGILHVYLFA